MSLPDHPGPDVPRLASPFGKGEPMTIKMLVLWLAARLDVRSDRGASGVEYAIFLGFIAVVVILAVGFLGRETYGSFCPARNC